MAADPFVDTDKDGLPDPWETLYGLDPNDNGAGNPDNGANGDPDGDGYTNLMEFTNGTSPVARTDRDADGFSPGEGDCDDLKATVYPGAPEICDGLDNNCDGRIDESFDLDGDGFGTCLGDCNDNAPFINPGAREICGDGIDNNCDGQVDDPQVCASAMACLYDAQCGANEYCLKAPGDCSGFGYCMPFVFPSAMCDKSTVSVCGCDGKNYANACLADISGVNVAASGECATSGYKWTYYFPAVKDSDAIGWENYLSVQAKNPVSMDVTIRAYDMGGALKGTYVFSDTAAGANAPAIAPNARVAQRPSWIAGSVAAPVAIEGSLIVETSVPAIASTNCIANFYKGFSIYEAAKVRPVHYFPKAFDGPNNYQVYMLAQNIYDTPRNVTVKLFGKNVGDPGDGAAKTVDIPAHGTLKVRPSEIAGGLDFNGSVVVYSNLKAPEDGLGLPVPAMCRYEAGAEALAIYESTARQPQLAFPVLKDGKFGGALDYQNFLSVVNMNPTDATITVILYNKAGVEEGRLANDVIPSGGKKTWRPGWIKGSLAAPADFEGSAVVISDKILVGQTNTIYPGSNQYGADAFDLIESAMPAATVFFPKAFDNLLGSGTGATHLIDNFVYVQNLDGIAKNLKIEQFNNNGTANGYAELTLGANATHVFRPKDLVTDTTGAFRGSVKVTERRGKKITGAIKYEVHKTTAPASGVEAMSIYRSMGM